VTDNISAQIAAIRSLRLTPDAVIGSILSGAQGRDAFGGVALSSRPYANTLCANLPVIAPTRGFTKKDTIDMNAAGISSSGNNSAGNSHILGQMVTTYKTDNAGNPDVSFKFMNYVDTGSNVREYFFRSAKIEFAQSRLTDGDLVEGRPMQNEASIRAWAVGVYDILSDDNFVLTRAGEDNLNRFKNNLLLTLDLNSGTVILIAQQTPLVSQLRKLLGNIRIAFQIND